MTNQDTTTTTSDTTPPQPDNRPIQDTGDTTPDTSIGTSQSGDGAGVQDDTTAQTDPTQKLQAELEQYKNLLQRERADFINFKRRAEEEKAELITFGQGILLSKLLPLYDKFEKSFDHLEEGLKEHEWVKGMTGIKSLFEKTFSDLDIVKIQSIGTKFDSAKHEAMMQVAGEKDIVISEFEAGFTFKGSVIKPARVSVGNGEISKPAEETTATNIESAETSSSPTETSNETESTI